MSEEELAMVKVVRTALDARLHADMSRRHFLQGVGGLTALTILGSASAASAQSPAASSGALGVQLNFIGYDGEDARNVAKPFFEANGITVNPTFIADAFEPLTRFETGSRGQLDIISDNKDFMRAVIDADVELFSP